MVHDHACLYCPGGQQGLCLLVLVAGKIIHSAVVYSSKAMVVVALWAQAYAKLSLYATYSPSTGRRHAKPVLVQLPGCKPARHVAGLSQHT